MAALTRHMVFVGVLCALAAFEIPGPCSFDPHAELDCDDGQRCPDGLACGADGHCQPDDVACDARDEDEFPGGAIACDGVCISVAGLQTDAQNCGACGETCGDGLACCAAACVSIDDNARCGSCDVACDVGADQTCSDGACRATCDVDADCADGIEVCCDGLCRAGDVDERCGGCDVACSVDELCVAQTCETLCVDDGDCPGAHCCGEPSICVAAGDPQHCGGCDSPCGADFVCIDDTCAPECAADRPCANVEESCCGGRCVDTRDDDDHCSACDAPCVGALFCADSACHDGTEADCCGNACTNCTASGDVCRARTCQPCHMYEQDCGSDASCAPDFSFPPTLPPDGRCEPVGVVDPPARFESCVDVSGQADCQAGDTCQDANDTTSVCTRFCDPSTLAGCSFPEVCVVEEIPNTGGLQIGICAPPCAGDVSTTCDFGGLPGTCLPTGLVPSCGDPLGAVCAIAGSGVVGDACEIMPDCAPGLFCDSSRLVCESLCTNLGGACPSGGTCQAIFGPQCVGFCQP